jgi:hypothetical protein
MATGPFGNAIVRGIVLFALLLVAYMAFDIAFIPWARSFGLWPTLSGTWVGSSVDGDRTSHVFLDMDGYQGRRDGATIDGRARWCDRGTMYDFDLSGAPDNWRGTLFHVSMRGTSQQPVGLVLSQMRGQWSGDEITAEALLISNARTTTISEDDLARKTAPPVLRYVLHRGDEDEFVAACGSAK